MFFNSLLIIWVCKYRCFCPFKKIYSEQFVIFAYEFCSTDIILVYRE